jgi:hypothetical protein
VPARAKLTSTIPVALNAKVNELGLLQVSCRSHALGIPQSWPLEFNLRPPERDLATLAREPALPAQARLDVAPEVLAAAGRWIGAVFTQSSGKSEKLTTPRLFQSLEQSLGRSKGDWNGILLLHLWISLAARQTGRALSVEHEETWLILAGFLLRPGFGVAMESLFSSVGIFRTAPTETTSIRGLSVDSWLTFKFLRAIFVETVNAAWSWPLSFSTHGCRSPRHSKIQFAIERSGRERVCLFHPMPLGAKSRHSKCWQGSNKSNTFMEWIDR